MKSTIYTLFSLYLLCWKTSAFTTLPAVRRTSSSWMSSTARFAQNEATFGMGCFWKPSEELLKVPGVIDTVVGYTGKQSTEAPSYDSVCFSREWVEGVRVIYDDSLLSYEQLLDAFFQCQEPAFGGSRQYASFIFPHNPEQERTAQAWLQQNAETVRKDGVPARLTQMEPLLSFYQAENYHQRYWQKMRPRIAFVMGLLAVSAGVLDGATPAGWQSSVHTGANAIALLGMLWVLLERKIDTKTVELLN